MGRRFGRLIYALETLRPPTATPGPLPDPPAGSILDKFKEYYSRERIIDYPDDAWPDWQGLTPTNIKAFGFPAAEEAIQIRLSNRALLNVLDVLPSLAVLEYRTSAPARPLPGFVPAKAVIRKRVSDTIATKTSLITGVPYKARDSESFTLPFGLSDEAGDSEFNAQARILTAVETKAASSSVNFKPERLRRLY